MMEECGENKLMEQLANLCMKDDLADVVLVVDGNRLPAHRLVLALSSEYFRALFYGKSRETCPPEIMITGSLNGFKMLLKYIYTNQMDIREMPLEERLDFFCLAHKYGVFLEKLNIDLCLDNAFEFLNESRLHRCEKLIKDCLYFMDSHAADVLCHKSFNTLSADSLEVLLKRDTFFVSEENIFSAILQWHKSNPEADIKFFETLVRLPLINAQFLFGTIRQSGIFTADHLSDAIAKQNASDYSPIRTGRANVVKYCEYATSFEDYNRPFDALNIELTAVSEINHIKWLVNMDTRYYSYYIIASVNEPVWDRIVDHTNYYCSGHQTLYFKPRLIRYIKVVVVHRNKSQICRINRFAAKFVQSVPIKYHSFKECNTEVVLKTEGDVYGRCYRDNEDIFITLGQPILVDSILVASLVDDWRDYQSIATSINGIDWIKRRTNCLTSPIRFEPTFILFIKVERLRKGEALRHSVNLNVHTMSPITKLPLA